MSRAPAESSPRRRRDHGGRDFELFDELMPIRRYKLLLQTFLKRRGAGGRQAIAEALGNTRSFVTQITSPAYDLAIPAQHVRRIVELAGLDPNERRMFLGAYIEAHPDRAAEILGEPAPEGARSLSLDLPVLKSPAAQRRMEDLIETMARQIAAAFVGMERDEAGSGAPVPPDPAG